MIPIRVGSESKPGDAFKSNSGRNGNGAHQMTLVRRRSRFDRWPGPASSRYDSWLKS
jgi:hypothetical protein